MKIIFLRHAITIAHEKDLRQSKSDPLSPTGIELTKKFAQSFNNNKPDLIICSDTKRAIQTAEIVAESIGFTEKVISDPLFAELRRPAILEGMSRTDHRVEEITQALSENSSNPDWRYSDEETFYEGKIRAIKTWEYIDKLDKPELLIVSHNT